MIYLDHNATTPLEPRVREAMQPFLGEAFGNPSSVHRAGRRARRAVEEAREQVAALLGAGEPEEVVFTSGGTEADALALFSARGSRRRAVAVSAAEHPAVAEPARVLEAEGFERRVLPVLPSGELDLETALARIDAGLALVSVMAANNEYGAVFPIARLAERARERGVRMHTDAVAATGKIDVGAGWGADMISISAHKIGGPKGVGALWVRRGADVAALFPGGGQERRRRGGTENVPGIAGFGAAAHAAAEGLADYGALAVLRDMLEQRVLEICPAARAFGR
ncbi:MAG TPA: aminotransferase class V-fold PLP-dependent enzyme, partial [Thermoanaerobaculia bacterium]|nr:aminotransferase class V-fold PLP-dependent enzyme [Thermoanaerobaculia bacterium]